MFTYRALFSSLSMIIASELGDKTFFIAAILAMRNNHRHVLAGAVGALAIMTILSTIAGFALPQFLPKTYTHYASIVLFFAFGIKLLKEASEMTSDQISDELEEVEMELGERLESSERMDDLENDAEEEEKKQRIPIPTFLGLPPILVQSFTMTFVAEWGDRSQIATIVLAAQGDPMGTTIGGIIGHALCTALAVYGGKMLATKISEQTVTTVGGLLFLLFGFTGLSSGP